MSNPTPAFPDPNENEPNKHGPHGYRTPAHSVENDAESNPAEENPAEERDQILVAYLDGELEEADRLQLEEQLIADEHMRSRLAELQSGWEMLDLLPPATVTDDFARTTVEMVAASQSRALQTQNAPPRWQRFGWIPVLLVATVAFGGVGLALPGWLDQQRFHKQLDTLPLAEHLDAYALDIDLDTIRALADDRVWNESIGLGRRSGGISVPEPLGIRTLEYPAKVELLGSLDNEVRSVLSRNWDRLQQQSPERREAIRKRAAEIDALPESRKLLRTLDEFAAWWAQLDPEDQTQILEAEGDARMRVIREQLNASERRWVNDFGSTITGADRELLYELLQLLAENRLLAARKNDVQIPNRFKTPEALLNSWSFAWSWQRGEAEPVPNAEIKDWRHLFAPPNDEELAAIMDVIGPGAEMLLLNERNESRRQTVTLWCTAVIRRMSPLADNAEAMQRTYELYGVDGRDRELLDLRPADRIFEELRRQMFGRGGQ